MILDYQTKNYSIKDLREVGRATLSKRSEYNVAALETDLLLSKTIGEGRLFLELNSQNQVARVKVKEFSDLLYKRKDGCPIAYLLGSREFMGYDFFTEQGVLIPRNDTEVVVDLSTNAIKNIENNKVYGLEIGVGSGIIGLTLLMNFKNLYLTGVDINPKAIELTAKNALYLDNQLNDDFIDLEITERFHLIQTDMFENVDLDEESLDFIVSNPPYIPTVEIENLDVDVKDYEPINALDGGVDGFDFYRKILDEGLRFVRKGGFVAFEIGYDQGDFLYDLMKNFGLKNISIHKDLSGLDRAVIGYK